MEFERAVQIFESLSIIKVLHDGKQVWIDGLNRNDQTAVVIADNPYDRITIPVSALTEDKPIEKFDNTLIFKTKLD